MTCKDCQKEMTWDSLKEVSKITHDYLHYRAIQRVKNFKEHKALKLCNAKPAKKN